MYQRNNKKKANWNSEQRGCHANGSLSLALIARHWLSIFRRQHTLSWLIVSSTSLWKSQKLYKATAKLSFVFLRRFHDGSGVSYRCVQNVFSWCAIQHFVPAALQDATGSWMLALYALLDDFCRREGLHPPSPKRDVQFPYIRLFKFSEIKLQPVYVL